MFCPICSGEFRHQVETDLLEGVSPEEIIEKGYGKFSLEQLRLHAVSHMRMATKSDGESIATKLAFKEAAILTKTYSEYLATLSRLGAVIDKQLTSVEEGELTMSQALSKATVDLYLGTGNQVRETVRLLTDTYADMNADSGERDNKSSINKLVLAINRSKNTA